MLLFKSLGQFFFFFLKERKKLIKLIKSQTYVMKQYVTKYFFF